MLNRMVYQSANGQTIKPRPARLLITTFDTWLPHQRSNAADDLIQQAIDRQDLPPDTLLLRHLPVDNTAASYPVCDYIQHFQPEVILCCGMAESRSRLNLERQATLNGETHQTTLPIDAWCDRLAVTDMSHDAGQFVCNYLYHQVLDSTHTRHAVFLHVPPLTPANRLDYAQDFAAIVRRIQFDGSQHGEDFSI